TVLLSRFRRTLAASATRRRVPAPELQDSGPAPRSRDPLEPDTRPPSRPRALLCWLGRRAPAGAAAALATPTPFGSRLQAFLRCAERDDGVVIVILGETQRLECHRDFALAHSQKAAD